MLDELLRLAPADGYPRADAGTLTYERAWDELLRARPGSAGSAPTLTELVRWGARARRTSRRSGRPAQSCATALRELTAGVDGAAAVLAAAEHGPSRRGDRRWSRRAAAGARGACQRGRFEALILGGAELTRGPSLGRRRRARSGARRSPLDGPGAAGTAARPRAHRPRRAQSRAGGGFDARLDRLARALDGDAGPGGRRPRGRRAPHGPRASAAARRRLRCCSGSPGAHRPAPAGGSPTPSRPRSPTAAGRSGRVRVAADAAIGAAAQAVGAPARHRRRRPARGERSRSPRSRCLGRRPRRRRARRRARARARSCCRSLAAAPTLRRGC